MINLAADALTLFHLLSFATGIGTALFLQIRIVPRFRTRIDKTDLRILMQGHTLITAAIVGLWVTGVAMLLLQTMVIGARFTPLMASKLAVVAILTVNMHLIERQVLPVLAWARNESVSVLSRDQLSMFGAIAGLSAISWFIALCLAGLRAFDTMSMNTLAATILPLLILAPFVGAQIAIHIGHGKRWKARDMRRQPPLSFAPATAKG